MRDGEAPSPMTDEFGRSVIEVGDWKPAVARGLRLLLETVVVPTMLLYACVNTVGGFWGLIAVLGWCAVTVCIRWISQDRIPATLLLAVAMLVGRTSVSLALSSIYLYLLQPVVGSLFMAVLFLGSAALGRPVTIRLAQDFVALPKHLFGEHGVRRLFIQVSILWGASRLIDAAMSLGFLHWGLNAGLLSRGTLSAVLTVSSVLFCAYWGWSRLNRLPGVIIRMS